LSSHSAEDEYSRLCTFLETILTMVWYPSCVATLSRYTRDAIEEVLSKKKPSLFSSLDLFFSLGMM
jgi:hypothetical protein